MMHRPQPYLSVLYCTSYPGFKEMYYFKSTWSLCVLYVNGSSCRNHLQHFTIGYKLWLIYSMSLQHDMNCLISYDSSSFLLPSCGPCMQYRTTTYKHSMHSLFTELFPIPSHSAFFNDACVACFGRGQIEDSLSPSHGVPREQWQFNE